MAQNVPPVAPRLGASSANRIHANIPNRNQYFLSSSPGLIAFLLLIFFNLITISRQEYFCLCPVCQVPRSQNQQKKFSGYWSRDSWPRLLLCWEYRRSASWRREMPLASREVHRRAVARDRAAVCRLRGGPRVHSSHHVDNP